MAFARTAFAQCCQGAHAAGVCAPFKGVSPASSRPSAERGATQNRSQKAALSVFVPAGAALGTRLALFVRHRRSLNPTPQHKRQSCWPPARAS